MTRKLDKLLQRPSKKSAPPAPPPAAPTKPEIHTPPLAPTEKRAENINLELESRRKPQEDKPRERHHFLGIPLD